MKSALAANAPIDEAEPARARAAAGAEACSTYLDGKIDSSRVFVVAPKLGADGIKDKGATTR